MKMPRVLLGSSLLVLVCVVGVSFRAKSDGTDAILKAKFNADGSVNLPAGYRNWTHVGTRIKAIGINILDGLPTKGPELLNAYVEPSAMAAFEKTGTWPDGAQIVKEFSALKVDDDCDPTTAYCKGRFGEGVFEAGYVGLGMMVKDASRFPLATGNWGYFTSATSPLPMTRRRCQAPSNSARHVISIWRPTRTTSSHARTSASPEEPSKTTGERASDAVRKWPDRRERSTDESSAAKTDEFYADSQISTLFVQLTDFDRYQPLPDDWFIGIADVVQSTRAIEAGRYKAVNTVGAAVLVAITNALPELCFPYVFGGDGATVAIPGAYVDEVRDALARTAAWSADTLDLVLRVAIIPVQDIRKAGHDVRVARSPRQQKFHTPCSPAAALCGRKSS